jgi:hypothetical protein
MEFHMSFREKLLWTTIIAGLLPYIGYFGFAGWQMIGGKGVAALSMLGLIQAMLIGMIIMIIAVVIMTIVNRDEGDMRPDEREKIIERRGITFSYHLLCTGVLITIGGAWWGWPAIVVIHILAFMFIVAELSRLAIELHGLRRGY